ncbi:amidohydrolase family protein [Streptomyces sp. SID3343]|uniref:amidohydrolase family protein n=1 Tax=Streptomyces sp. SID3343 TaxID=2690260 RepID=UPI0031F872FE
MPATHATPPAARPRRLFDAHLHIVDPRFPLTPNAGYLPPAFTADDYRARVAPLGVLGGAVVSGSFQGFDQNYLLDALRRLGPAFVGVTQLPAGVTDETVFALDAAGVRAVRFNVRRGGSETLDHLDRLARRVHELAGWHVELYLDARDLPDLAPVVGALPRVSIDHLGLSREGLPHLLGLVEQGAYVKATGFGRGDLDIPATLRTLITLAPHAVLAGTDLPSTRAPRPFEDSDLALLAQAAGEPHADAVLYKNAQALYRPKRPDQAVPATP